MVQFLQDCGAVHCGEVQCTALHCTAPQPNILHCTFTSNNCITQTEEECDIHQAFLSGFNCLDISRLKQFYHKLATFPPKGPTAITVNKTGPDSQLCQPGVLLNFTPKTLTAAAYILVEFFYLKYGHIFIDVIISISLNTAYIPSEAVARVSSILAWSSSFINE